MEALELKTLHTRHVLGSLVWAEVVPPQASSFYLTDLAYVS